MSGAPKRILKQYKTTKKALRKVGFLAPNLSEVAKRDKVDLEGKRKRDFPKVLLF